MSLFYKSEEEKNPYPEVGNVKGNNNANSNNNSAQDNTFKNANQQSNQQSNQQYNPRTSVLLKKDEEPQKEPGCCDRCCACFSIQYYKDYFKVTNQDVKKRILSDLKFWQGDFFKPLEQDYDLYGPFWIYTTIVFLSSAIHNIIYYQNSNMATTFTYDYTVIGAAMTIFYILGLALSAVIGLIFGCVGLQAKTIQIVCLYGYSMTIYAICLLLCIINYPLLRWLFLLYAAGTKIGFILRNIFQGLEVPAAKKVVVIAIVVIEAALQFLIIKFVFIKAGTAGAFSGAFSHMQAIPSHNAMEDGFLHLRTYLYS